MADDVNRDVIAKDLEDMLSILKDMNSKMQQLYLKLKKIYKEALEDGNI